MNDKEMLFRELLKRIIKAIDEGAESNGQVTGAIRGRVPLMGPSTSSVDASLAEGLIKRGDLLVITAGVPVPFGVPGTTNLIKVHIVGKILARGTGIGNRAVVGNVRVCMTPKEALNKVNTGDILVAVSTDRDFVAAIQKAGAIITEEGGLTSHAAIVGLNLGVPVVVGVDGATKQLKDGFTITVDSMRGLIYRGATTVL
jgi:pyruvate kinase